MSFVSGPVSFQRFFVTGPLPQTITDEVIEALESRSLPRVAPLPDDTRVGWIGPRHVMDTPIAAEQVACGAFLHLAVRVDRLKPPASIVKAYVRMEEEAAREAAGRPIGKSERARAKERALQRAEKEARNGDFRRISSYPLLIDLAGRCVYLGGLGTALGDRVMQLFSDTFGCALESATPETVARRLLAGGKNPAALDNLPPLRLVQPPDGYEPAAASTFIAGDLSFLGKEMLTWLWHQSDVDEGRLAVRHGDEITVMLDRALRLKCDFGLTGVTAIAADAPTRLPEAKAAIRIGKQPVKAGLVVGTRDGEFRFTLDAMRLTVSGLMLADQTELEGQAALEARFEQVVDAASLIDALFDAFLTSRLNRNWAGTQHALAAWASGKPLERRISAAGA